MTDKQRVFRPPDFETEPPPKKHIIIEKTQAFIGPGKGPMFKGKPLGDYRRVELRTIAMVLDVDVDPQWTQQQIIAVLTPKIERLKSQRESFRLD